MKDGHKVNVNGGIGFAGALQLVFIVLKLMGYIDWPWLWVLSPIWISAIVSLVIMAIFFLVAFLFLGRGD